MLIKVALNGNRSHLEHSVIPIMPDELAVEAQGAVKAGAGAIHMHPRDASGHESLRVSEIHDAVAAVREACADVPIGVSTGAWIEADTDRRLELIGKWSEPDFASVNFDEPGAEKIASLLLQRMIGVEAGLSNTEAAKRFCAFGQNLNCLRILIEPSEETPEQAEKTTQQIETILDNTNLGLPRLLHGTGATTWAMVGAAARRRYDTRIGFEDTLLLPNEQKAESNAELVHETRQIIASLHHPI